MSIDRQWREAVRKRANFCCEYCHSPERISATRFTIDHVQPRSLGGLDALENLALACRRCNERRLNFTDGVDPKTGHSVPLFDPRRQDWNVHFYWSRDADRILGMTDIGRATIARLDMNDERYADRDSIRNTRRLWVKAGWHPPTSDRREL